VKFNSFATRYSSPLTYSAALALAALAALPLFLNPGFLNTRGIGDSPNLLFRVHQLLTALAAGEFPARWMPDAAYGYGMPYFTYYASFSTHVAAAFKLYGFSFVNAIKLAQLLALLVAAGGMVGWLKAVGLPPAAQVLASAAYTFAPFHLVNLYIRGDSLAELWAMSLFPIVLWAAHLCLEKPTFPRAFAFALATATLICTHNISALNFMPFMMLYGLSHFITIRRPLPFAFFLLLLLWGFALAAFFWLPALLEGNAVQLSGLTGEFFSFTNHFRAADLVQTTFLFDYQTNPFSMGLIQTTLAVGGLLAVLWRAARARQWPPLNTFLLLGLALSTLMMTPLSQPLWENLPLLSFTQFPWRFLSIQALFTAALAAQLVEFEKLRFPAPLLTGALSILLAFATLSPLNLTFIPLTDDDVTAERLNLYEYFTTAIGNTVNGEYLPQAVQPRPFISEGMLGREPQPKALSGEVSGERMWKRGASENWRLTVSGNSTATLAVPKYFWPGWQATANGQPLTVRAAPGLGWITFDLPPGAYTVELWLGRTPLRAATEAVSLLALLVPLSIYFYRKGFPKINVSGRAVVIGTLVIVASWIWLPFLLPTTRSVPPPLNADYNNLAYFHRDVVRFGEEMELLAVNYSAEEVEAGAPFVIETTWRLDRSVTATFTLRSHAAWVGGAEGALATAPVFIDPTQTSASFIKALVTMTVPANTPPGLYFITVALNDKQAVYPALTATGQERGLIHLAPILVTQRAVPVELRQPLAGFGAFDVQAASAEQNAARVQLNLLWHTQSQAPMNYKLALRVRDLLGNELSGADTQPNYGFYPTVFWQAGELIPDTLTVPRPEGLPPGTYTISFTPYNPETLAALGTLEVTATLHSPLPPAEIRWPLINELGLAEVEIPPQAAQGSNLPVTAHWVTVGALSQNFRARWTLTSAADSYTEILSLAPGSVPCEWGSNLAYFGRAQLSIPNDLAAGTYALSVQLVNELGQLVGSVENVGSVEVLGRAREFTLPPLQTPMGATFDEQIVLAGYNAEQTATELKLQLAFQALTAPRGDYKYFVHLFDPLTENIPAQMDTVPRAFTYPTSLWVKDEVVVEDVMLALSAAPPGAYRLAVGWYNPNAEGLPRLPARSAEGQPLDFDRVILPLEITIAP